MSKTIKIFKFPNLTKYSKNIDINYLFNKILPLFFEKKENSISMIKFIFIEKDKSKQSIA